jgi:hypothetical protein
LESGAVWIVIEANRYSPAVAVPGSVAVMLVAPALLVSD